MKKHFSIRERELLQRMTDGKLTDEDVQKAFDLAKETSRIEHRALYAEVKHRLSEQPDEEPVEEDVL